MKNVKIYRVKSVNFNSNFENIMKFKYSKMSQFYMCMNRKKVCFDPNIEILHIHVWSYAYHNARKSNWKSIAADRYRFELRKKRLQTLLDKINFFHLR